MGTTYRPGGGRWQAAGAALLVEAVLGTALLHGLVVAWRPRTAEAPALAAVFVAPDPPPPPRIRPHPVRSTRPEGAASPPNLRARATEVVAPPPPIPLPVPPPPVVTAPLPDIGARANTGSADIVGPGTGSGGVGDGRGSGGEGDGDGAGGEETPPRQIGGRIRDSDYPADADLAEASGMVGVRYRVGIDGRASDCAVTETSGSRVLDATTCRLIERRFRFRPSRDGRGRPVPSTIVQRHEWIMERLPPEPR